MTSPLYKKERNETIYEMRIDDGLTYKAIGFAYGISVERVRQIVMKQQRIRDHKAKQEATA